MEHIYMRNGVSYLFVSVPSVYGIFQDDSTNVEVSTNIEEIDSNNIVLTFSGGNTKLDSIKVSF